MCGTVSCFTRVLGSWTLETVERVSVKIDSWEEKNSGGEERRGRKPLQIKKRSLAPGSAQPSPLLITSGPPGDFQSCHVTGNCSAPQGKTEGLKKDDPDPAQDTRKEKTLV